ncbi:dephospho-CoA kinase [Thalassomonas sp. M1454]|uniref:dephospho-CoA kinase n=1 Tax=Thalassomonas sp. M1454 TaxID=2594477 RepID=UPI00117DA4D0|nr:dephospho-CoA kinase [Thalassomonas sp. M1454]TRX52701.1 dephospho-CoA kinase [Thalassomonas sp. M1454]
MSKLIIGLTGGIGSGKTTVADIFAEYGIDIIDADVVAREVVKPGSPALKQIAEYFGDEFILSDGNLNRSKLRDRIFSNPSDKAWLNALLHPLIREAMNEQCLQAKSSYCFLVAPLLIENNIHTSVDKVLVVDVKPETQLTRTTSRDNNTQEQVQKILASQVDRETRLAHADYIIDNDKCTLDELRTQIELMHREFLKLVIDK